MTIHLLDVNLLLALSDPMHVHHEAAHRWFAQKGRRAWATCPITENGFVRISSHPSYPNRPGDVAAVLDILHRLCRSPGHHFWPEDISILQVVRPDVIVTHAQVTDVYLLALAVKNRGRLATLDQRIPVDAVQDGRKALALVTP